MTEKRFFLKRKFLGKDKFHDIICHKFMDSKETEEALNLLYDKYSSLKKENKRLKYDLEHKQEHINQLTRKPLLTDILPQAHDILRINSELEEENEQLKKAAKEFAQNQTQHNLWRLRTVLKDSGVE